MNAVIAALFDLDESVDNGEREITTASGEKRIWHFVTAPIGRDARGRRMLVTNAVDVTERRRLEQALAEKEARTRLAMEAANYGGWEWDAASGEMVWSDKMRELLGVGRRRADQLRAVPAAASSRRPRRCASARSPRPG